MWALVSRIILRYRAVFIWLIVATTFFMYQQSKNVKLSYSMARLLPQNSETQLDFNYFVDRFGQQRDNVMTLAVQDVNFFTINHFHAWEKLGDSLRSIRGVKEVISLSDALNFIKDDNEKKIDTELLFSKLTTQESLDIAKKKYLNLPFYKDIFFNEETSAALMLLALDPEIMQSDARIQLVKEIEQKGANYTDQTEIPVHYSGLPYIRIINAELIRKEVGLFVFLAIIVTAIILYMFFKSFKAMFIAILVVAIGVVWSFGTLGIFNYEITVLSALIPPLLIVIGVPNCIFLINKYHNEYKSHGNKAKALTRMIRKVGNVTILTNATTASGFATFVLTSSKDLREFGLIASVNIFAVFLLSLLLIPIIFSYLNPPSKKHTKHLDRQWINRLIEQLIYWVTHRRTVVYVWTILLVIVGGIGLSRIHTTGNVTDDLPKKSLLYNNIKFLEKHFHSVLPFEIIIDTHRKNGMNRLSTLKRIDQLQDTLATYSCFSRPVSFLDVIKFSKQSFYNGDSNFYDIPNSQEKSWLQSYYSKSNIYKNQISPYISQDRQIGRISVQLSDIGTSEMKILKDKLREHIDQIFDPEKYDVKLTGTSVVFLEGTSYLVKNLFISLSLAVILISIFMAWMFNSFRMVIVSLVPNLIPLLLTAAIMGYFGIAIKPSTVLVFSIAFGISVDDTIHFLAKYHQELKTRKHNIRSSVLAAIRETGVSMIYTSIVLFCGFFIFITSQFGGTVALGILVSITLMIAMLSNLVVLPALLLTLEKSINAEAFQESLIIAHNEDVELNDLKLKNIEEK